MSPDPTATGTGPGEPSERLAQYMEELAEQAPDFAKLHMRHLAERVRAAPVGEPRKDIERRLHRIEVQYLRSDYPTAEGCAYVYRDDLQWLVDLVRAATPPGAASGPREPISARPAGDLERQAPAHFDRWGAHAWAQGFRAGQYAARAAVPPPSGEPGEDVERRLRRITAQYLRSNYPGAEGCAYVYRDDLQWLVDRARREEEPNHGE